MGKYVESGDVRYDAYLRDDTQEVARAYGREVAQNTITLENVANDMLHGRKSDRTRKLVRDALRRESAEDAARLVEDELQERAYEGFNLVVADRNAAILLEWDGLLAVRNFDPGVHVVVNVGADDGRRRGELPVRRRAALRDRVPSGRKPSLNDSRDE